MEPAPTERKIVLAVQAHPDDPEGSGDRRRERARAVGEACGLAYAEAFKVLRLN